ncbi:phosphoadenylyl-sulfate reductase [bacterium]|nr:phosphoadenylyl-sulfate reductase [bacterium]|tara:strand:+ start:922 stop:1662 length:741 start_codon:yes stop_codon:yes gene_type:complete
MDIKKTIKVLNKQFSSADLSEVLTFLLEKYDKKVILASSLGLEDQVLTHRLLSLNKEARIFVLDTLRLNDETYDVLNETKKKYQFEYEIYYPNKRAVNKLTKEKGVNSFYESITNRKECCAIRKLEPLQRVLKTVDVWITGLRKDQSITRINMELFEYDEQHNILKVNPLINWSYDDVWEAINQYDIPYNKLHNKGYPSIGCDPCTRAIKLGEDLRAGRWWWEAADQKECGLHNNKRGKKKKIKII